MFPRMAPQPAVCTTPTLTLRQVGRLRRFSQILDILGCAATDVQVHVKFYCCCKKSLNFGKFSTLTRVSRNFELITLSYLVKVHESIS